MNKKLVLMLAAAFVGGVILSNTVRTKIPGGNKLPSI
jgi:hypothetical protein